MLQSSLVWSSGRWLVRVLYPLACVNQWVGKDVFTLFWLFASIMPDVRCIDVFTYNSLRNKGDNLATIVWHIEPTVLENKMLLWGERPWKTKAWLWSLCLKVFDECDARFGFGMIIWILGLVCSNQGLIVIIMLKCYLNATLSIIGHVLFMNFFYTSLFMVSLPLFVCLCVRWSYNVCVIRE